MDNTNVGHVGGATTTEAAWQREIQRLPPATRTRNPAGTQVMYDVPGESISYLLEARDQIEKGTVSSGPILKLLTAIDRIFQRVAD